MGNLTKYRDQTIYQEYLCSVWVDGTHTIIFLVILNILLSITAFLGNALIFVALQKVSSLRPSSKLLFRCLVVTDLSVGLITQPIYIMFLMSPENSAKCRYAEFITEIVSVVFCGVSLLTLSGISVDRLLALMLGIRYRHVVTLGRVRIIVALFWLLSSATSMTYLYNDFITMLITSTSLLLCAGTSTFCYSKIYLTLRHHQAQVRDNLQPEQPNEARGRLNAERYRSFVSSALWVQMVFVACYLPYGIATIIVTLSKTYPSYLAVIFEFSFSILVFNSSLNPILYCWRIREVRKAVKKIIRKLFCLSS